MSAPLRRSNVSPSVTEPAPLTAAAWYATIAGLCGSLVAIGLARFAYTPLIPPLISAHWFSAGDTVTLGAANFAGYLAGALLGRPLAAGLGNRLALRLLMVAATAAFFACAFPVSVTWFFVWRFLSGLAGGAIMVLVATTILPHIPVPRRGFVSGMIFLGLGLGIAASGTLVPALLRIGLRETWIGLGVLSLILTAVSWFGWPATNPPAPAAHAAAHHPTAKAEWSLRILYGQYAANALGLVPVMVLLVDYVARGLGRGADIGAACWVLYGVAAITGPVLTGYAADRIGFAPAYRGALLLQAVGAATLATSGNPWLVGFATVLLGIFTPGIVPLVLGRIQEILPHSHVAQRAAWSRATTAFALFQALGGYGYSYLFIHTGENYGIIFLCGAVALVLALLADVLNSVKRRKHRAS
ncbi:MULTISPECIES: YbfB/YjiJ family MFS transporter [Rhizobium]|uniref:Putative MFS family arabinose efflux permease n=1 Tax=Rhizobium paranaense TaxID=1650438 RepID=A0A7W8XRR0_9HYPH|nr:MULTISPECIES: YbfB/YjiJ family MFS transporter [Rhizobium]MBB5574170.1 putative MFS family arabinose efflux permease [Rhizobium paranaense]PST62238.1 MFS transporter [Rhizobium sp. SEMIA4064]